MKKNFAGQPEGGGGIVVLKGYDLLTEVQPQKVDGIFQHRPLFVDNCKNCGDKTMNLTGFANADAATTSSTKTSTLDSILENVKFATTIWAGEQQRQTQQQTAQKALEIEQAKLAAERTRLAAEQAKGQTFTERIKAYTTPIIVGGVVVIAGIGAYFYFKKKKIS